MSVLSAIIRGEDELSPAFSQATGSAEAFGQTMSTVQGTANDSAKALDDFASSSQTVEDKLEGTTNALEEYLRTKEQGVARAQEFRNAIEEQEQVLAKTQEAYMGVAMTMGKNSDEAVALKAEIGELQTTLDEFNNELLDLEESAGKAGKSTVDSVDGIKNAIVAAGLAKLLKEGTDAVIEMANEFSRAESIIVKSTGAVGAELDGLSSSMMTVFRGAPDAMGDVATVLATINTATGVTGGHLEELTDLTLKYARVNNEDAGASAATLGRLMNAMDMDASSLASTMDQLTLASQMSGLGVNAMAEYVIAAGPSFEEMGFSMERSIALFSSFYQAGAEPRELLSSLNILLNRMASEGLTDAEAAFDSLLESIMDAPDILSATTIASEAFGARVGAKVADDIRAGRFEIDAWVDAIGSADGVLVATADAALTLEEQWSQATNSISAAFTSVFAPAVDGVSSGLAGIVQGVGDILNDNPKVTAGLSTLAVGLGVATAAAIIFKAAVVAKTAALALFAGVASTALGPVMLVAGVIAAVATAAVLLSAQAREATAEFRSLTSTSKQNYEAMRDLEAQYEAAASSSERNADEVARLSMELETARAVYESNRMTIEELVAANDKLIDSHNRVMDSYNSSMDAAQAEEQTATALIAKYEELAGKAALTAGEQMQMAAVTEKLNSMYPELSIGINDVTGRYEMCATAIKAVAAAQAEEQRNQAIYDSYVDTLANITDLEKQRETAYDEYAAARERYDAIAAEGMYTDQRRAMEHTARLQEAQEELDLYTGEWHRLNDAFEEANTHLADTEEHFERVAEAANAAAEAAAQVNDTYEMGVEAVEGIILEMDALIEQYDAAYGAARTALDSTFGLFEKVEQKAGLSSQKIIEAWESQIEFFNQYNDNLQSLQDYDLDADFLAKLSDGSQESAAQVAALTEEFDKLSPAEVEARVSEINDTFATLEQAKDVTAETMAEVQTEFSTKLAEMEARLEEAVNGMDMGPIAREGAAATMRAYIDEIKAMEGDAVTAASNVARSVANALNGGAGGGGNTYTYGGRGYASGTSSAARGLAMVGEDGPEIIDFDGGERVYNADETSKILSGGNNSLDTSVPDGFEGVGNSQPVQVEKKITLDINGSGGIEIGAGTDENAVIEIMIANLKPILLEMVNQEKFEEGNESYDF